MTATSKTITVIIILMCSVSLLVLWATDPFRWSASTDENMINLFAKHNNEFQTLRQMAVNDRKLLSHLTKSSVTKYLDNTRSKEYQSLMPLLSDDIIITVDHNKIVRFIFSGGGLSAIGGGWIKGIEYRPNTLEEPEKLLLSLNEVNNLSPDLYLKKIEPSWYIFYQYND